jgi:hypothetical protein
VRDSRFSFASERYNRALVDKRTASTGLQTPLQPRCQRILQRKELLPRCGIGRCEVRSDVSSGQCVMLIGSAYGRSVKSLRHAEDCGFRSRPHRVGGSAKCVSQICPMLSQSASPDGVPPWSGRNADEMCQFQNAVTKKPPAGPGLPFAGEGPTVNIPPAPDRMVQPFHA